MRHNIRCHYDYEYYIVLANCEMSPDCMFNPEELAISSEYKNRCIYND